MRTRDLYFLSLGQLLGVLTIDSFRVGNESVGLMIFGDKITRTAQTP